MKLDLNAMELAMVVQALELKISSLERARKNLSGSLQLAYAAETTAAQAVLVKLKGAKPDEEKKA